MARNLPDMADHGKHLGAEGKRVLSQMAVQYLVKPPSAFWLSPGQWEIFYYYLKGGGFDVERGFVFRGIPVKKFNA